MDYSCMFQILLLSLCVSMQYGSLSECTYHSVDARFMFVLVFLLCVYVKSVPFCNINVNFFNL